MAADPKGAPRSATASEWKAGPMATDTWWWGGVVVVGQTNGFYFAEFFGDHAILEGGKKVLPDEVALYDNSLIPPESCRRSLRP